MTHDRRRAWRVPELPNAESDIDDSVAFRLRCGSGRTVPYDARIQLDTSDLSPVRAIADFDDPL